MKHFLIIAAVFLLTGCAVTASKGPIGTWATAPTGDSRVEFRLLENGTVVAKNSGDGMAVSGTWSQNEDGSIAFNFPDAGGESGGVGQFISEDELMIRGGGQSYVLERTKSKD